MPASVADLYPLQGLVVAAHMAVSRLHRWCGLRGEPAWIRVASPVHRRAPRSRFAGLPGRCRCAASRFFGGFGDPGPPGELLPVYLHGQPGSLALQHVHERCLVRIDRVVKHRPVVPVDEVDVGVVVRQQVDDGYESAPCRVQEGGTPVVIDRVDVCAVGKQQLDDFHLARLGSIGQGGDVALAVCIDVGALVDEVLGYLPLCSVDSSAPSRSPVACATM